MKKISNRQKRKAFLKIKSTVIPVELAETQAELREGLQGRKGLSGGMLFVHPEARVATYWMRETELPLSIAFIDEEGIIVHTADMNPHDETPCESPGPVKFALEVPQGFFKRHAINVGDKVSLTSVAVDFIGLNEKVKQHIVSHELVDAVIPGNVFDYVEIEGTVETIPVKMLRELLRIDDRPTTMGEAVAEKARATSAPVTKDWIDKWYEAIRYAVNEVSITIMKGAQLDELEE